MIEHSCQQEINSGETEGHKKKKRHHSIDYFAALGKIRDSLTSDL